MYAAKKNERTTARGETVVTSYDTQNACYGTPRYVAPSLVSAMKHEAATGGFFAPPPSILPLLTRQQKGWGTWSSSDRLPPPTSNSLDLYPPRPTAPTASPVVHLSTLLSLSDPLSLSSHSLSPSHTLSQICTSCA